MGGFARHQAIVGWNRGQEHDSDSIQLRIGAHRRQNVRSTHIRHDDVQENDIGVKLPQGGPQVAVVVLGAKSNAGRFWETRHLFNWLSSKAQDLIGGTPVEAAAAAN